jgi:hypothetical protein
MKNPPEVMLGGVYGDGAPVIVNGEVDPKVLAAFARRDILIAYPPGANPGGRKALDAISQAGVMLVAKVTLSHLWDDRDATHLTGAINVAAEGRNALIYVADPKPRLKVNLNAPGMVEDIVRLIRLHVITPALLGDGLPWKGIHIEGDHSPELWARLYGAIPLDWILWWNGGSPEITDWVNRPMCDTMDENWPFQNAPAGSGMQGAFARRLDWYQRGIYSFPLIFTGTSAVYSWNHPINRQRYDYGAACAWMFRGGHIFAGYEPNDVPWWQWDVPHYDLGPQIGEPKQEHGAWRQDGEGSSAIIDPTYPANVGNPVARGRAWLTASLKKSFPAPT